MNRWWLVLLFAAIWALIVVISDRERPAVTAVPVALSAIELAQLAAQARTLCATDRVGPDGFIQLPDGVLLCTGTHGHHAGTPVAWVRKAAP
jgi:hypothetical protein